MYTTRQVTKINPHLFKNLQIRAFYSHRNVNPEMLFSLFKFLSLYNNRKKGSF